MNRIKKHIKGFFSIAILLVILASTTGFNIHKHHCNHNHTNYYSIFAASNKCDMHAHKAIVKSCCETKEVNNCDTEKAEKGCCTDNTQIVKLETKTTITQSCTVFKPVEIASIFLLIGFHTHIELTQTAILIHEFAESPPPLSTPEYLSLIQVYTI